MRPSFNRFQRPGALRSGLTRPIAESSVGTNDIRNAIERGDAATVRKMLEKANLSPQTCRDLLKYAFEQADNPAFQVTFGFERSSSSTIKTYLLQYPARNSRFAPELAQFALELAISHKDISTARKALQRGADPENIPALPDAEDMRALLVLARRRNLLYPSSTPHADETDLDKALRNVLEPRNQEEADKLLKQAIQGNLQEAWRDAVKENRLDIQRAILLLHADQDRMFRLLQKDPVTDPGVIKVMKEIPYFSPKRGLPEDFNVKTNFLRVNDVIRCCHLAEHRQAVQEQSRQLKFDDAQYASKEAIATHVSYDTEAKHYHLLAHAAEAHLFHNRDFGKTLVQQLDAMILKKETTRLLLLTSTNHVMSVGLKIKEKDGKPHYVAELFDPERTTSHVRVASDSLHAFEMLTLKNFIASEDLYKDHYPEPDGLSMMLVRPSPQEKQAMANPAPGAIENRMLTSCIEDKEINATAIWHMLENGFSGDLRRLKNEIASRPAEKRIQLLFAKDANGTSGILWALYNGRADAIRAFGELLKLLPPQDRIKLLKEIKAKSTETINIARKDGHNEAIKAFNELFS